MTEKLLQYLWNYKIFNHFDFKDKDGFPITVVDFGKWNTDSGPDFLMGKIEYRGITLVGNIELHLHSSDWELHQHSNDIAYENVILHVVFSHDKNVEILVNKNIPTLVLQPYISESVLQKYNALESVKDFIPCEKIFDAKKIPFQFCEEKIIQKLDEKSIAIEQQLLQQKNNYEAVLFHNLAYAFGLKINADIFQQLAMNIDFLIVQKIRQNPLQLEAVLLGMAGWLDNPTDETMKLWAKEFGFIKTKYNLSPQVYPPKFLRLRPPNFPTIRLSQLANLYHREAHLFSKIISATNIEQLYNLLNTTRASEYWDNHYNFGKETEKKLVKGITKEFMDIVIINAILPLLYTYYKNNHESAIEEVLKLYTTMLPEANSIISEWKNLGISCKNALETQAYLYHYKNYCLHKKCLECNIGFQLLKS